MKGSVGDSINNRVLKVKSDTFARADTMLTDSRQALVRVRKLFAGLKSANETARQH